MLNAYMLNHECIIWTWIWWHRWWQPCFRSCPVASHNIAAKKILLQPQNHFPNWPPLWKSLLQSWQDTFNCKQYQLYIFLVSIFDPWRFYISKCFLKLNRAIQNLWHHHNVMSISWAGTRTLKFLLSMSISLLLVQQQINTPEEFKII